MMMIAVCIAQKSSRTPPLRPSETTYRAFQSRYDHFNRELFGCAICGRCRLNPYAIAYDQAAAVVAHDDLHNCTLCGDGCMQ